MESVNRFMAVFDSKEEAERRKRKRGGQVDEDGFKTVVYKRKTKRPALVKQDPELIKQTATIPAFYKANIKNAKKAGMLYISWYFPASFFAEFVHRGSKIARKVRGGPEEDKKPSRSA